MSGSKIPVLIIKIIQKLLNQAIPTIIKITEKTGIQNIGQPNMKMPGLCLPKDELDEILKLRNNIIDKLNSTSKILQSLKKPLNVLNTLLNSVKTGLRVAKISRLVANRILLFINPPLVVPGAVPAGINTLKDLEELLNPIVTKTSNSITILILAIDYANSVIFKLLKLIETIDQYLNGCGISTTELTSTSDYINQVNQQYTEVQELLNEEIYKEFTLEIVEEEYTPTLNRRKAVAKNKNGIILLSTPLSFTTDNQTLINQLKLLIDSNDLKAD